MSVNGREPTHSDTDENLEDDHILNHLALSHACYLNSKNRAKTTQVDMINNSSNLRKRSFNVYLPRKLSKHTESDLRLMLISLKH